MCRGTTNGEDVYIIPIYKIPNETLETLNTGWVSNHGGIPVDECIGAKVEELIINGIQTVGSCCGHGTEKPHVLVREHQKNLIESMGYLTEPFRYGLVTVFLK